MARSAPPGTSELRRATGIELLSVGLIGQAVGLLALTNIDDHLDRKCASQSEGLAATRSIRD